MGSDGMAATWPARVIRGHLRTSAAILVSLVAFAVMPAGTVPASRAVMAWDAGAIVFLVLATQLFLRKPHDDSQMARNAEAQSDGEWVIFFITLAGVVFSFVALTVVFSGVKDMSPANRGLHVSLVGATLLVSWLVTHVVFALRYAHEYYAQDAGGPGIDGGLEFPGELPPDYWDFVYFSIVLGMTFQVSDVQITSRKLRRLATVHGLIGFLFNTIIVALTVNIAASLL